MRRPTIAGWGASVRIAVALAIAVSVAPAVRSFTAELNQSVGRVWPFSLAHCHAPTTPGCSPQDQRPAAYGRSIRHAGWIVRDDQRPSGLP